MACNDSNVPKKRFVQLALIMGTKCDRRYQVEIMAGASLHDRAPAVRCDAASVPREFVNLLQS
ncbi:MAG: hypothetical protein GDA56_05775 [Hormoscilla sp. GM7CHS1pb]|nr:hypothetical protein [Hormoscilla sp. GM7CHS1pb]